ncbi:hypothetical protein GWK47_000624 [Chionoecetes opilio]|uniref:Uncharacterized protein n=1 Tax=Chionoecetes opilio TaxID=41210 RepID=A0A8J5CV81_CHIOP|nr:hypothetical protein GWK47_000624 [Chionoecetes opilio]
MWQYLADYGTPRTSSWTTEGSSPAGSSSSSAHDTKSLFAIRPLSPSRKFGDREMHRTLKSSLDPVSRNPLSWPTLLQPSNHYESSGNTPPLDNNLLRFFSRHAPGLLEQLYPTSGENKMTGRGTRPNRETNLKCRVGTGTSQQKNGKIKWWRWRLVWVRKETTIPGNVP